MERFERANSCYCKYTLCACCIKYDPDLEFRDTNGQVYHLDVTNMRGEPGDMRWENIYVNKCEMAIRRTL